MLSLIRFTLTLKLMVRTQDELYLDFLVTQFLKLLRILEHYAQGKRESEQKELNFGIRDPISTESFLILWRRVETLQMEMEEEENLSMETNLMMKISNLNIQSLSYFLWQMQVKTLMDHNSLLLLLKLHGLMESIQYLERFWKVKIL